MYKYHSVELLPGTLQEMAEDMTTCRNSCTSQASNGDVSTFAWKNRDEYNTGLSFPVMQPQLAVFYNFNDCIFTFQDV